jgi:hypothetical protein
MLWIGFRRIMLLGRTFPFHQSCDGKKPDHSYHSNEKSPDDEFHKASFFSDGIFFSQCEAFPLKALTATVVDSNCCAIARSGKLYGADE